MEINHSDKDDDRAQVVVLHAKADEGGDDNVKRPSSGLGRTGTVSFRPYTDLSQQERPSPPPKKRLKYDDGQSHLAAVVGTRTVDDLYPELLCLLLAYLDVESKGRAAQASVLIKGKNFIYL